MITAQLVSALRKQDSMKTLGTWTSEDWTAAGGSINDLIKKAIEFTKKNKEQKASEKIIVDDKTFNERNTPDNSDSKNSWILPTVAVVGTGAALAIVMKRNKKSKLSGMKFGNFKSVGKNIGNEASNIALIIGGTVASRKFIDFNKFFANRDPNNKMLNMMVQHQGAVKFVAGLLGASMVPSTGKMSMLKMLLYGMALDGGIQEIRVLTSKDGNSWVPSIGQNGSLLSEFAANSSVSGLLEDRAGNTSVSGNGMGYTGPVTAAVGCGDYSDY